MKRFAIALIAGAAVSTLVYASASALIVDGGSIQAGQDTTACDSDGVKANWGLETVPSAVTSVRISGVAAACAGADLFVRVDSGAVQRMVIPAPATALADVSVSFPAFAARTPESIESVKVWIEG